uniref:zinc finger FYVE domain-containing protein 21-like isoform X2 n=1 Tax=Myxine glutinosa TaxID=7769 RepID=UPI00358ECE1B
MASPPGKKLVRSGSGLRMVAQSSALTSPFALEEPRWIADKECDHCMQCKVKFDFLKRKHHCRRCGHCLCESCCSLRLPLPRMSFVDPVRQCKPCSTRSRCEEEFYGSQLASLQLGASLQVSGDVLDVPQTMTCKLSNNHRFLYLDGASHLEVEIVRIETVEMEMETFEPGSDQQHFAGIMLKHGILGQPASHCLCLRVPPYSDERQRALTWLSAMQQAVLFTCEAQSVEDD